MFPESPLQTRLHWSRPEEGYGTIESYSVKMCRIFRSCDPAEKHTCRRDTKVPHREPAAKISGKFLAYTVNICATFESCGGESDVSNCTQLQTYETWLNYRSNVDTKYCVMVATSSQCGEHVLNSRPAVAEIRTPLFVLPDVTNLNVVAADNHYITMAWDRPRFSFDFYWLDVTGGYENENVSLSMRTATACGNGTIIHPQQTQITCGPFDSCSSVDVTVRTYTKGPPELMSTGATLSDIFINGQDLPDVTDLRVLYVVDSAVTIAWKKPEARFDYYWIFAAVEEDDQQKLPDVSNLTVGVRNGYITLSWQRPQSRFDYYSLETFENDVRSKNIDKHKLGLCANGTIVHRDQTEVTCGPFEPCTKLSCTVRTHLNGQSERISSGVTVKDIFIPAEVPLAPRNISMVAGSPSQTQLRWERPNKVAAVIESYSVKICRTFTTCGQAGNLGDCKEYETAQTSVAFDSIAGTPYCILVTANTRCGIDKIRSRPAVAELRTPIIVPPDVTNLHIVSVGTDSFTAAWERPKVSFDYYWIEVTGANNSMTGLTQAPPPVTDLKLVAIAQRYFKITYKTPKECYTDFNHYIAYGGVRQYR
ncbi:uncharacterized protein LOC119403194 [Rhipicephalus sanguineus]|uniref:uncharacterized protein LOC119403194 n=1 Tax=Rhipicephalus sanguineus TaxID=34632 RepID=UPI0020C51074|nr:uncharacterized protein LOC119403194 [Rhipicephalus sanguineus]